MVPRNINFWSISRKESLESQQKPAHRNRFLLTPLCSNDSFNPGYNRKMLMRKTTSIPSGVCFNCEQLFHPVQCTACRICQCSSRDKLILPKLTGVQIKFIIFQVKNCFGIGTRQYSTCLYLSENSNILYSYLYILSILSKIFPLWSQYFQCLAIVAFQLQ